MKFIIDISSATGCFAKSLKVMFMAKRYTFKPLNKSLYLVDTDNKTCVGVDSNNGHNVYSEAHGIYVIKKML